MKEKIIEMLKNGIPHSAVARACGVDPSYVTQLMGDEQIREEVALAKVANLEENLKVDQQISKIEKLALNRVEQLIPFVSRPSEAVRVFEAMNSARKKTEEVTGLNQNPTAPLVEIHISAAAAVAFKMNNTQQVVEVDGRSMATLPSRTLMNKLKEKQEARPLISDATTAQEILEKIEQGIPQLSIANVL